jgi:AP-1 complex subunit mu
VPPSQIERFLPLILDMEEENVQVTPCFTSEGINFMHIRISNLYSESRVVRQRFGRAPVVA